MNVNVVDCPPKDIALLEPEQVVTCCGTMNCICLFDTDFIYVTAFPHTDIDRPSEELSGNPVPAIVATIPPPGDVTAGVTLVTVIGTVVAVRPDPSAYPICTICTLTTSLPAASATLLSAFVCNVQVNEVVEPVNVRHCVPNNDTVTSDRVNGIESGLVSETAIDAPVRVADEITGLAAALN